MSCLSSETYSNLKRRKFLIFLIAAMIALFLLLFFINLSYSKELPATHSVRNDDVHELKLLHVVSIFIIYFIVTLKNDSKNFISSFVMALERQLTHIQTIFM